MLSYSCHCDVVVSVFGATDASVTGIVFKQLNSSPDSEYQ